MLNRASFLCLLLSLSSVSVSSGESLQEVVRPRSLLQFDGLLHRVSLVYDYSGRHHETSSSTANHFKEAYHIATGVSVLDPETFHLGLSGDLILNQASEDSSRGVAYQYDIIGSAFLADPYPMVFANSHKVNEVVTAFLPAYTATSDTNQLALTLLNKFVPLKLQYMHNSLSTEGLRQNSSTDSSSLLISATHTYRDRSSTSSSVSFQRSESELAGGDTTQSRGYSFSLTNALSLDRQRRYVLTSRVNLHDSLRAFIPQRSLVWEESLAAKLGKALSGGLSYQRRYNRTLGFDSQELTQTSDSVSAGLTHKLFESLETRVRGNYSQSRFFQGKETEYGETFSLAYRKRLLEKSLLRANLALTRQTVTRDVSGSELPVRDELHPAVQQGDVILLAEPGRLGSVLSVTSRSPDLIYQEGVDYTVNLALGRLEILNGGSIVPGTDLFVSYRIVLDPQVKYSTNSLMLGSSISSPNNRYLLTADLTRQDTSSSGDQASLSLYETKTSRLRLDANFDPHVWSIEYADHESGPSKYAYLSGEWRHVKRLPTADWSFFITDRYTRNETEAGTSDGNDFRVGTTYSTKVLTRLRLFGAFNYGNSMSGDGSSNYMFVKAGLSGRVNLMIFSLSGQSTLRLSEGEKSRDDYVHFEVSRTF